MGMRISTSLTCKYFIYDLGRYLGVYTLSHSSYRKSPTHYTSQVIHQRYISYIIFSLSTPADYLSSRLILILIFILPKPKKETAKNEGGLQSSNEVSTAPPGGIQKRPKKKKIN
jgi:hypothetical protein